VFLEVFGFFEAGVVIYASVLKNSFSAELHEKLAFLLLSFVRFYSRNICVTFLRRSYGKMLKRKAESGETNCSHGESEQEYL
jgi:hypothetical protein